MAQSFFFFLGLNLTDRALPIGGRGRRLVVDRWAGLKKIEYPTHPMEFYALKEKKFPEWFLNLHVQQSVCLELAGRSFTEPPLFSSFAGHLLGKMFRKSFRSDRPRCSVRADVDIVLLTVTEKNKADWFEPLLKKGKCFKLDLCMTDVGSFQTSEPCS